MIAEGGNETKDWIGNLVDTVNGNTNGAKWKDDLSRGDFFRGGQGYALRQRGLGNFSDNFAFNTTGAVYTYSCQEGTNATRCHRGLIS